MSCSLSSSNVLFVQNVPKTIEFNLPYTIVLSSNTTQLLPYSIIDIEYIDKNSNKTNSSFCSVTNQTFSTFYYKTEFTLKFERNSTKSKCIRLKLRSFNISKESIITHFCVSNDTIDKIIDSDDIYDVQPYLRTLNTSEIAISDNFNWLIFGSKSQQIWDNHEGMRLSRECDTAEDGRVAIFNNPRGKRKLISRPFGVSNISLIYMRLGSGTCSPPIPTDPPFQLLITTDCVNYSNWHVIYSQRILPGIEYVTVPIMLSNVTNSSNACLKIEQEGDKFISGGSWFIDDLFIVRTRYQNEYFYDQFDAMRSAHWQRLAGGQLKTCDERMSMVFESNMDIRTDIGATTIDFTLPTTIDYKQDVIFQLSKKISIDWTKWNATGFVNLNKTCTDKDVITFNGENFRQICSPLIELNRVDSVRFTLSAETCTKQNQSSVSTPNAVIFLSIFYNTSAVGYSRTIRRISLRDIQKIEKTYYIRLNELRHGTTPFGRICLSQYHQSSEKNIDIWSVRDFAVLPLLQSHITHYVQLGLNSKCSKTQDQEQQQTNNGGAMPLTVNVEYSVDFGKNWHALIQPCFIDSTCSHNVQHIYSSKIALPTSGWHRVTLPLPIVTLQQEYIRFRIGTPPFGMSHYSASDSWAIDKVFIGRCPQACTGHGWCQFNSCRCDEGFSGKYCEKSNLKLFNRISFSIDHTDNQTDSITYQGGRPSFKCDIISRGKSLVFSKPGFRYLRISNINGSTPKLLEFTFRLGDGSAQCFGTSKNDQERDLKSILLLSSCSNGVHWTIVDRFRISDTLAPNFGSLSRILFESKVESESCLIEWRQVSHGGDNQDVWAIDDITIRDVISTKQIKKSTNIKNFQSKLTYIRPGYILSFRLESINRKEPKLSFKFDEIQLKINSTEIDLVKYSNTFSYQINNSTLAIVIALPQSIWYEYVLLNLTIISIKKFQLHFVHIGVQCENNCWLNGICFDGMCLSEQEKVVNQSIHLSLNEDDLIKHKINILDDEILLPLINVIDLSAIHFQTVISTTKKNNLLFECSPNGGIKWFEIEKWTEEKDNSLKDHYVLIPDSCQGKQILFRWKNSSVRLLNVAFVKSHVQHYFMDQFQQVDSTKWLYPTFKIESTKQLRTSKSDKALFQLISTSITLKQHDYIIMIDMESNLNTTHFIQVDYSLDNITWHKFILKKPLQEKMNRFGKMLPTNILNHTILIRIQSNHSFVLNHVYIGPPCPANCYGHGKCLWIKEKANCYCDKNRTSETNCLPNDKLLSSLHETFENKLNSSQWSMSSDIQITYRCYNRLSKTTPYLCVLPHNHTESTYATIGPFKTIKYVFFKFGIQYVSTTNCSNQILFQYSYDNGIQWFTKKILDETNNIFEKFDDLPINTNIYLRWIEENDRSCLMWNLRSIIVRTKMNENIWFENNLHVEQKAKINYEVQTWEFPLIKSASIIQFDLQMFPIKKTNDTNWHLTLEISSDIVNGWSNWINLLPPCNQTNLYCEDNVASTGSSFPAKLYEKQRSIIIPIPDNFVNQEVRFRWSASQSDARFTIKTVYVGGDCPWFCSGHGICQITGCQCNPGYALPFCSPDPLKSNKNESLLMQLDANFSTWFQTWGYEKCSVDDERLIFSKAGTRGLISPELSLIGIKYLRIELDTCFNRTQAFLEPIYIQLSLNNGILWKTLTAITYRHKYPNEPWLIQLPNDDDVQYHLVRIRLFQRASKKGSSSWLLRKFEMIPYALPDRWKSDDLSINKICNYKDYLNPIEMYSTVDVQLNETSVLTFQIESSFCSNKSLVKSNISQFYLEYSIDYGQTWSTIDRSSTVSSNLNDIVISQPIESIKNVFHLPIYTYSSLSKFIRIRWLAENATVASQWIVKNIRIRSECEILCELEICNGKCRCSDKANCSMAIRKKTFFYRFNTKNNNSIQISNQIRLPLLNLQSTRFIEFEVHMTCENRSQIISLEYSRNMGISWQIFKFFHFDIKQLYIIHEDLLDEMKYDYVLIRFVFLSTNFQCLNFEKIIVSGSIVNPDYIYSRFDQVNAIDQNLFVSFGDGTFNGTFLVYPITDSVLHEIITDDLIILQDSLFIQLNIVPIVFNRCINVMFTFSTDYGNTWQSTDQDDVVIFDSNHSRQGKILTWKFTSLMIGSNQIRFRIHFVDDQILFNKTQNLIGISELYVGSNCVNACHGRGMCLNNARCRCNSGWTNVNCNQSLTRFPNEINILKSAYYRNSGTIVDKICGTIFNSTCKREFETNYIDIYHTHTYVHIELNDECMLKTYVRKNGEGWIRLQYREINSHQWTTYHIFKGYELKIVKLLPRSIIQLRLVQDLPILNRLSWSIEQFQIFHIHSRLQLSLNDNKNETESNLIFLNINNILDELIYETKDVYFNLNYIVQIEFNCSNITKTIFQYSYNLGLTWFQLSNDIQLKLIPIQYDKHNVTLYRLTVPFDLFSNQNNTIRFRFHFPLTCQQNSLQYLYIGNKCPMNCYGNGRCQNAQCQINSTITPIIDFRETFENDFHTTNWLQLESYRQSKNRIFWTTIHRQAITQPISLRSIRAIKWTYNFEQIPKTCSTTIYFLISTDGTLTWSILHRFDIPIKSDTISNTSIELIVELESMNYIGQFRWFQPISSTCSNFTWGLSRIISLKTINNYFLNDYFYGSSSSYSNWETIDGALLAQPDQCNNNLPALIFYEKSYSAVTVPILIQSYYVLVFQFNAECNRNSDALKLQCRNLTGAIEYRTRSAEKWIKLVDMDDLACRTSLLNGGYFNMHTIKLPTETFSR